MMRMLALYTMFVLGITMSLGATNRTIPLNTTNSGTDLPLSNPTGGTGNPMSSATTVQSEPADRAALSADMRVIDQTIKRLGQQLSDKDLNSNSIALTRDLSSRLRTIQRVVPPSAAGLTGSTKNEITANYQTDIRAIRDRLSGVQTALMSNDNDLARRHYEAIRPLNPVNYGIE